MRRLCFDTENSDCTGRERPGFFVFAEDRRKGGRAHAGAGRAAGRAAGKNRRSDLPKTLCRAARSSAAAGGAGHRGALHGAGRQGAHGVPPAAQGAGGGGVRGAGLRGAGDADPELLQHRAEGSAGRAVSGRRGGYRGGDARQCGQAHPAPRRSRCAQKHQ